MSTYERSNYLIKNKFHEYLFPTIMTTMAVSLAAVVDSVIVGNLLGTTALAAVGLTSPIIFGINMIFLLFAVGSVACASIAKGKRDQKSANLIFTLGIFASVLFLILYAFIMLAFLQPITQALAQGNKELQELAYAYIIPTVFVGPFMTFSLSMAQFWRVDGSPKISAVVSIVANVVNLILDYILIRFLNAGIAGAGISTMLGYVAGVLVVMPYIFSKKRTFRFAIPKKSELKKLFEIMKVGLSKALTQGMSLVRSIFLNAIVVFALGSLGMSAMAVCLNALMITCIVIGGSSDALLPISATLYGERDYFGVRTSVKTAFRVLIIACISFMLFFLLFPVAVGSWFGISDPEGLAVLIPALRLYSLSLPFYAINQLLQNFYAITGRTKLASIISVLDGLIFVVCFALLFMMIDPNLLWLAYLFAELCTIGVVLILGKNIRKKEKVTSVLLMREDSNSDICWDTTISATIKDATGLSAAVIDFCKKNKVSEQIANRMGVAVEEMAINTSAFCNNKKTTTIDILVRITEDELILRFRDDGIAFDPTVYDVVKEEKFEFSGIKVIEQIAKHVDYARQLGFNTTVIVFNRNALG